MSNRIVRSIWKGADAKLVAPTSPGIKRSKYAPHSGVRRPGAYGANYDETAARGVTPVGMAVYTGQNFKDR